MTRVSWRRQNPKLGRIQGGDREHFRFAPSEPGWTSGSDTGTALPSGRDEDLLCPQPSRQNVVLVQD
ncbi:hypothetical protein M404DRAFT_999618 [Pisolithus tinctorius Marx 270]|uniref:Uncharacterized protein n=1 Tax=Pisolithus tinctorius Marx 270 TaxID=870435 RepID=A0A0C3JA53_PISTI|nr:hypothetical protein M404DRAFT_999618 [Pisolithus tinctorius Marx 270]